MSSELEKMPRTGEIIVDHLRRRVTPDQTNKIHNHSYSEIILIKSGIMTYTTGQKMIRLGVGSVIYNPEGFVHNPFVQYSQVYERYKIKFYRDGISCGNDIVENIISKEFTKVLSEENFGEMYTRAERIFLALEKEPDNKLACLYAENELRAIIMRTYMLADEKRQLSDIYISQVAKYIKENIKHKLTIESLASEFFVSKSKLIYDFKAYSNMSINEYITLSRTELAKDLLKCGYSVSAVADECGFSSSSYFIRVFTSVVGITPLQYQIRARGIDISSSNRRRL